MPCTCHGCCASCSWALKPRLLRLQLWQVTRQRAALAAQVGSRPPPIVAQVASRAWGTLMGLWLPLCSAGPCAPPPHECVLQFFNQPFVSNQTTNDTDRQITQWWRLSRPPEPTTRCVACSLLQAAKPQLGRLTYSLQGASRWENIFTKQQQQSNTSEWHKPTCMHLQLLRECMMAWCFVMNIKRSTMLRCYTRQWQSQGAGLQ